MNNEKVVTITGSMDTWPCQLLIYMLVFFNLWFLYTGPIKWFGPIVGSGISLVYFFAIYKLPTVYAIQPLEGERDNSSD